MSATPGSPTAIYLTELTDRQGAQGRKQAMKYVRRALLAWIVFSALANLGHVTAVEPAARQTAVSRIQSIRFLEFEDIVPGEGLLLRRARYTQEMYKAYTAKHVLT